MWTQGNIHPSVRFLLLPMPMVESGATTASTYHCWMGNFEYKDEGNECDEDDDNRRASQQHISRQLSNKKMKM